MYKRQLYSRDSLTQALQWFNATFGRHQIGYVDSRGRWLGLLFLGIVALAWPLSALLPVANEAFAGAALPWKKLLIAASVPALLTPLILRRLPTDFLPVLLGDYLCLLYTSIRRTLYAGASTRARNAS